MGKQSLGIDISDGQVTAVVLEQQRNGLRLVACHGVSQAEDRQDLSGQLLSLCEQLQWQGGVCVCGLPLSRIGVRNLSLPFRDPGKIAQALPFELEEQLLSPVDTLVTDFTKAWDTQGGSMVIAFAAERRLIASLLEGLGGSFEPEVITPAVVPLCTQLVRLERNAKNILLLHTDLHSFTMAFILEGRPIFYRRLSYPEKMILHPPFHFENGQVTVTDSQAAEECIHLLCSLVRRSLDFFRVEHRIEGQAEQIVLTGPLAAMEPLGEQISRTLELPLILPDLLAQHRVVCPEQLKEEWQGPKYERALALALVGQGKKAAINFRTGPFAVKRRLFTSRRQMAYAGAAAAVLLFAGIGYLWSDYRQLHRRDQAIRQEMTAIYRKTFPEVTRIQDPYIEMQAKLKKAQGGDAPIPLFAGEQRALSLLADISARIPANVPIQVSRLAIDRESVLIKGTTETFNAVNSIKNALAASPRYKSVQIVSATADKDKKSGMIRFEIQLHPGGL